MFQVFPTEVSCTVPNVGAAGGEQNHNGLCILSQNIINEKMYLVIWVWMVTLIIVVLPYILFRISTVLVSILFLWNRVLVSTFYRPQPL